MISVLIPLFNGSDFLNQAIDSVQKQTYKKWKIYIGINGHGLNSNLFKRLTKQFENNDKIIVKEYDIKSKAETLNLLAKETTDDYVALLDVDDKWEKTKLEKQIPLMKKYDVVGTAGKYIGDKNTRIHIEVGPIPYERIFFHNSFINSSILMKREDVEYDDVFLDDYNMWFKLMGKGRKFYNHQDVLTYHRLHKNSFFNKTNNGDVNQLRDKWLRYYDKNKLLVERFGVTVIMPLLYNNYQKKFIKMSFDSVLNQSLNNYEFIIVINADNIIEIVKEIINESNLTDEQKEKIQIKKIKDKSIKKRLSERQKKFKRRQYADKCMSLGKFNLMAFIEPRDVWMKEKLMHQVKWIHGYDAICVGGTYHGGRHERAANIVLPNRDEHARRFYRSAVLIKRKKYKNYPIQYIGKTFLFHRHMNLIKVWW